MAHGKPTRLACCATVIYAQRDETRREHLLELLPRLGMEQFGIKLARNHCQKGIWRPLTCRQRLARIAQSAKQNSKAKAIGIATALFNRRQVCSLNV
jgi:hypothetical protein